MPSYDKRYPWRPWYARVRMYGRSIYLGRYVTWLEALSNEYIARERYRKELASDSEH